MKWWVLIPVLLLPAALMAQKRVGQARIDSLLSELSKAERDTNEVKILNSLSFAYSLVQPDSGLRVGKQALRLAQEIEWIPGVARAHKNLAENLEAQSNHARALEHLLEALKLYESLGSLNNVTIVRNTLGNVYTALDDHDAALAQYHLVLALGKKLNKPLVQASAETNIGRVCTNQKKYTEALAHYDKALAIYNAARDTANAMLVLGNVCSVYRKTGEYEQALVNYHMALRYHRSHGLKVGATQNLHGLGYIYSLIALDTTGRAFSDSLRNKTEMLDKSERYLREALAAYEQAGDLSGISLSSKDLSYVYDRQGRTKEALAFYRQAVALNDSVFSEANREKIAALVKQQQEDLKQKQIDLQRSELSKAKQQQWFLICGLAALLLFGVAVTFFMFNLRKEKVRSEHLLHNILPLNTANELKTYGHAKPRRYDCVTVVFTDFKEFAKLAERLSPEETVSLIHHYFTAFDRIVKQHGLEKIKTIGDAYMAAAGVPVEDPYHALHAVKASIAIRDFVKREIETRVLSNQPYFDIRIGVHTGPVVAGIVGESKFAYDIWGETVNLAARMESSADTGRVNISGATYKLIKDKFICDQRGAVEVKHGGLVEMYFVESEVKEAVSV